MPDRETIMAMSTDIALNLVLTLLTILFAAVGLHASVSPVLGSDAELPVLRRRKTRIWAALATLAFVNMAVVVIQARRQSASTVSLGEFRTSVGELKGMISRVTGVNTLASVSGDGSHQNIMGKTSKESKPSQFTPLNLTNQTLVQKAKSDTLTQANLVSTASKPETPPLTPAQVHLVLIGASQAAREIRAEFASATKAYVDRIKEREQNEVNEWMKNGKSRGEAQNLVNGEHTGGAGMMVAGDYRQMANDATHAHIDQLRSIASVLESDPTRYQGELMEFIKDMLGKCEFPVGEVETCTTAIDAVATAIK